MKLQRRALLRGPLGGSKQWTLVWAALVGVRLLKRVTRKESVVVFSEELKPGDSLLISGGEPEPRVIGGHVTAR